VVEVAKTQLTLKTIDRSFHKIKPDFSKSSGCLLFDTDTQMHYMDLFGMYSSLALGYNHPIYHSEHFKKAVMDAVTVKITHNEMKSKPYDLFIDAFSQFANADQLFSHIQLTCTGSLAVEVAIKIAIFSSNFTKKKIIRLDNSFHGITAYGNFASDPHGPAMDRLTGFPFFEDWPVVKTVNDLYRYVDESVAAILIEPVRCTAGDQYVDKEIFEVSRLLTNKFNIPLIFDEIQTGFGVTGKPWYFNHLGVNPDMVIFGKKAQTSGVMVNSQFADIFEKAPTKLSVTFDGDVIDLIRCRFIIEAMTKDHLLDSVSKNGETLCDQLKNFKFISNVRGIGYLIAFDLVSREARDQFVMLMKKAGLLVNPTAERTVRMRPPLSMTRDDINTVIEIIRTYSKVHNTCL
tara:strand:+ start:127 stop:1335 length:1209 start_codon:yes stop_codon:yes gene_type:complete